MQNVSDYGVMQMTATSGDAVDRLVEEIRLAVSRLCLEQLNPMTSWS